MFWSNLARKALQRKAVREGEDPDAVVLPFDVARNQTKSYDVVIVDHAPKMDLHIPGAIVVSPIVLDAVSYGPSIVGLQELGKMDKRVLVVLNRF
uniref:hypothetical protein n=1 Tax=Pandoraea sp. PE-S2T-3 TaxID=1986993 RepID=UPI001C3DCD38